jgi:hypothetical protein
MSLTLPPPPSEALSVVRNAIGDVIQSRGPRAALMTERVDSLDVAVPHPVYAVGLEQIAQRELLSSATLVAWRYLLLDDQQVRCAVEVDVRAEDRQLNFSHINRGPFVANSVQSITVAETLAPVQQDDYELRLLKIPGLYLLALWLHGPDEIILPIAPSIPGVVSNVPYSESDLLTLLQPIAEARLRQEGNDLPDQ